MSWSFFFLRYPPGEVAIHRKSFPDGHARRVGLAMTNGIENPEGRQPNAMLQPAREEFPPNRRGLKRRPGNCRKIIFTTGPGLFVRRCVIGVVLLLRMLSHHGSPPYAITALCCVMTASASTTAAAEAEKRTFNLPRGDAALTLKQFAAAAGTPIIYLVDRVRGATTNAVRGELTPREALERMLVNSGLEAAQDGNSGAFIVSRKSQKGEVGPLSDLQPKPKVSPMKSIRTMVTAIAAWLVTTSAVEAQTTPAAEAQTTPAAEAALKLETFSVTGKDSSGYRAINSVSGTLISTPLNKLPIAIQVITDEVIRDLAVTTVEDAIRYTSGMGLQERNEGAGTTERYNIRGFQSRMLLRNGVPFNTQTDSVSIERIEVVKGPSGVLFGASDPGGLINYITKQPLPVSFTRVRQRFASYDGYRTELDLNYRLNAEGTLLFRMPASYLNEGSWLRYGKMERIYLNPVLAWTPLRGTRISVESNYQKQDGNRVRDRTPFRAGFIGLALPKDLFDGANFSAFMTPITTYDGVNHGTTVKLEQTISDSLVLQAIWDQTDLKSDQFIAISSAPTIQPNPPYTINTYSTAEYVMSTSETMQLSLVKSLDFESSKHRILFGFRRFQSAFGNLWYRSAVNNPVKNITVPDPDPAVQFYTRPRSLTDPVVNPALVLGQDYAFLVNSPFRPTPYSWSTFLTDQASFMDDRLRVLAGIRYDKLRATSRSKYTPQVGVNYELRRGLTAYALYSEGFKENGRSDSRNPNSAFNPPETSTGMEVGLKLGLLDDRLSGTIALFDITRGNVQVTDGSQLTIGGNTTSLAGEQKSQGLEVDLVYTPTPALSAILAYSHMDARTTKDLISPSSPDLNGDGIPDSIGMQNESAAKNSASLWVRYRVTQGAAKGLMVGLGGQWRQGPIQQFPTANRVLMIQPDDTYRFDAMLGYTARLMNRPVDLRLNVQNITDNRYWDRRAQFNAPRIYQFSVGTEF